MAPSNVSLKLMIDKRGQRVLFAEADKDFVDFLFSLLTLPIGTVVRLLDKDHMVGCFAKLYQSIKDLNNDYIQCIQQKNALLEIKSSISIVSPQVSLLPLHALPSPPATPTLDTFSLDSRSSPASTPNFATHSHSSPFSSASIPAFATPSHSSPFSTASTPTSANPFHRSLFSPASIFATPSYNSRFSDLTSTPVPSLAPVAQRGLVKGAVTYMVMDDLVVTPMSAISSITLLNKFNIKEIDTLEEKVVHIGMDQGLEILKNALSANTVLTNVFLGSRYNA